MAQIDGIEQGANEVQVVVERLAIAGMAGRGHLYLEPMAEPEDGARGRVYLGTDGTLAAHDGAAWRRYATEAALLVPQGSVNTTFNADGTITTVYGSPRAVTSTTTFNADGSITEVYGSPISQTRTTTFNADGSISTAVS